MIIPKLIEYLTDSASISQYVGAEAPEQTTDYILIDQTGSSTVNHITTATVAIQCYGATLYDAMALNETVKVQMMQFAAEDEIASVRLETDYNFTNTATKQYCWQAVYHITHYLGGI